MGRISGLRSREMGLCPVVGKRQTHKSSFHLYVSLTHLYISLADSYVPLTHLYKSAREIYKWKEDLCEPNRGLASKLLARQRLKSKTSSESARLSVSTKRMGWPDQVKRNRTFRPLKWSDARPNARKSRGGHGKPCPYESKRNATPSKSPNVPDETRGRLGYAYPSSPIRGRRGTRRIGEERPDFPDARGNRGCLEAENPRFRSQF